MAHEIETHDSVILHERAAWHGLGIVVQEELGPVQSMKRIGLNWEVEQWPLNATQPLVDNPRTLAVGSHVLNVRADIREPLGIVSKDWQVVQNVELAAFCEALAEGDDQVVIESAGSIRNGKKVWFLLKGKSFSIREDEVIPYICVSNGFDGRTAVRATPTTIRVVCSNTLHMVIPHWDNENNLTSLAPCSFVCNHTGNIQGRIKEAKEALGLYNHGLKDTRGIIDTLAAKDVKSDEDVQKFFLECYSKDFDPVPANPKTKKEERARERAMKAFREVDENFESEARLVGTNYWGLMNAYTSYVQHGRQPRMKDRVRAGESKLHSRMFGTDANRTHHALEVAISA